MRRGLVAGAILAVWVGSLAWLAARQRQSGDQVGGLDDRLPPSDAYLALRLGDEQIGIVSGTLDTVAGGARTVERLDLLVAGADGTRRRILATDLWFGSGLALEQLSLLQTGDGERFRIAVARDTSLRFTARVTSGGDTASWHWPVPTRATVRTVASALRFLGLTRDPDGGLPVLLLDPASLDWEPFDGRVVGDTVVVVADSSAKDPATGRWVPARWDTVTARRVEYTSHGLPFDAWVDADGNVVRAATPLGAALERTAFEIVRQGYDPAARAGRGAPGAPLLAPVPGRPVVRIARLTVVLEGADTTLAAWGRLDLGSPFQTRRGNTLEVREGELSVLSDSLTLDRTETALTRPSGAVPASHPLIEAQARQVARGGTDPAEVARAVAEWVEEQVALDPEGSDHPVAALGRHRASAEGRTALFLALLRAVAIPARPVAGLRWDGQAFHYHGWAEVRLAGGWLPVDPALGQFPADGGRLRLATGVGADPVALAPLIGRLRPRVTHVEPGR
jgi:transglutaminase-like putative cysteine protease